MLNKKKNVIHEKNCPTLDIFVYLLFDLNFDNYIKSNMLQ